jgi:hypothetical protein
MRASYGGADEVLASCLRLSRLEQPTADTPPAHVLAHPERIDPAGPAPAPAVHAGHQLAVAIGLDGQKLAEVSDARRLDIELVDLVDQTPHSRALSLAQDIAAPIVCHLRRIVASGATPWAARSGSGRSVLSGRAAVP